VLAAKQVALRLGIFPKTCDHRIQRRYGKAGCPPGLARRCSLLEDGLVRLDEAFAAWRARAPNPSLCAELPAGHESYWHGISRWIGSRRISYWEFSRLPVPQRRAYV
jgi:hypothetical protein